MKATLETWAYLLASNGILLYGILTLGWPIFPLVFLWWWEGLLSTAVSTFIGKRQGRPEASWGQLFPYFVYLIFLIVFIGIMAAHDSDQVIFNLMVLFFKNSIFNLSLLLLILHLGYRVFNGAPPREEIFYYQIRIHVGILLGALAIFLSQKLGISNLIPVALTVLAVKLLLDIWTVRKIRE
jgi:hypothetical protein